MLVIHRLDYDDGGSGYLCTELPAEVDSLEDQRQIAKSLLNEPTISAVRTYVVQDPHLWLYSQGHDQIENAPWN